MINRHPWEGSVLNIRIPLDRLLSYNPEVVDTWEGLLGTATVYSLGVTFWLHYAGKSDAVKVWYNCQKEVTS